MADNKNQETRRRTRKEALLTRKQQEQFRQIRLALFGLIGLIVLILGIGALYSFVIEPGQPVADVNGTEIPVRDYKTRVSFEREQTMASIDSLYEAVGGDVNQLAQFAGQQLQALNSPAIFGNQVLFQMIDEELIRQESAERGISVSDEEVQTSIEERFNYYDGESPPEAEESDEPEPTPTITPIPAEGEEAVDPEPTEEPEPVPTATAVSQAAFDEQYQEQIDSFVEAGGDEASFRERIKLDLLADKLEDSLAEEEGLDTEELQVSMFYIAFSDRSDASAVLAEIEGGKDYLTVWNEIRSAERVTATQPFASELDWTATETVSSTLGSSVYQVAKTIDVGAVSEVIPGAVSPEGLISNYFIVQVRGREERPVSEANLSAQKSEILQAWLEEAQLDVIVYTDRAVENTPDRPYLDPKYYTQAEPTAVPEIPEIEVEPTDQ